MDDKYIGLCLAASSSLLIGVSFILTKKGLIDSSSHEGTASGDTFSYLTNYTWWAGMVTMVLGEIANFAAYSFAPAILVTPLGALSVLISAILASLFLNERLGSSGKAGCGLCLIGSVVIVLHSPEDKEIISVDQMLHLAIQPAFMVYCILVLATTLFLIYRVVPSHGRKNPLVYITICSLVGSVSVMAVKGFGIALKLTFAGSNQLTHSSTYIFAGVVAVAILTQMNYFNKALDLFSTNIVTPIYYVFFTTATIVASALLFQGFNESNPVNLISLFCGFFTIFVGVFLLNSNPHEKSPTVADKLPMYDTRDASKVSLLRIVDTGSLGLHGLESEDDSY
ncbi:DUF803-domain-containing protein [Basidiobolus meristosporus CBS 931.73]|uniref:DUF803-domain-containing protein n=1 Tax=Basidiobolus meristosporus CBS 931.73 TaxID=1314790 RepID=A0A1Y1YJS2_9FUNG|nr:DUF803-domain-containing protein [Basidiobolus meristosporus CBS 931.73]|eukprot:ORX98260.1 DUF803-domain-containing protein [Basidiobolus meristosporus CBS 931.73]